MLRLFSFSLRHPLSGHHTHHCVARTREHAELRAELHANDEQSYVRCDSIHEIGRADFMELDRQGIFDTLTRQEQLTIMAELVQRMMREHGVVSRNESHCGA